VPSSPHPQVRQTNVRANTGANTCICSNTYNYSLLLHILQDPVSCGVDGLLGDAHDALDVAVILANLVEAEKESFSQLSAFVSKTFRTFAGRMRKMQMKKTGVLGFLALMMGLLLAAFIQLYTVYRIDSELRKEKGGGSSE